MQEEEEEVEVEVEVLVERIGPVSMRGHLSRSCRVLSSISQVLVCCFHIVCCTRHILFDSVDHFTCKHTCIHTHAISRCMRRHIGINEIPAKLPEIYNFLYDFGVAKRIYNV